MNWTLFINLIVKYLNEHPDQVEQFIELGVQYLVTEAKKGLAAAAVVK